MKNIFIFIILFYSNFIQALSVETYSISQDKTILALAYDDLVIRLYDLNSGEVLHELKAHENSIQTVQFNQDGSRLISGDWGDYAIIWDVKTGKIIKKKNMGETVMHAIYTADDKYLVMAIDEAPLAIFDSNLKKKKGEYAINARIQLSSNKKYLAGQRMYSPDVKGDAVIVVDLLKNKKILEIPEDSYDDEIYFSQDASIVVVRDSSVFHVWEVNNNKKLGLIDTQLDVDESLINPIKDKELWLTGGNKVEVWDYRTQSLLKSFEINGFDVDEINAIAFSPDGKTVALSVWLESDASVVVIIDTESYQKQWQIEPMSKQAFDLQFIDNDSLFLNTSYPIEIWDMKHKKLEHLLTKVGSQTDENLQDIFRAEFTAYRFGGSINGIDVDAKGNIILTGTDSTNSSIGLDDKGQLNKIFQNNYSTGYDARYSHGGDLAAFAYHGEHLLIYNTADGSLYVQLDIGGVPSGFRIIKFSDDDSLLAIGSDDGSVYIVDVKAKKTIKHIEFFTEDEYSEGTFSLLWINKNKLLVGTLEHVFELDVTTEKFKKVWQTGATALHAYFENSEVSYIAVGQYEDELIVLDKNYRKIKTSNQTGVGRIATTADGKNIIALTDYNAIIWNLETDKVKECGESDDSLWAMAYDASKHRIYVGGDEGKVHIYDDSCKELN